MWPQGSSAPAQGYAGVPVGNAGPGGLAGGAGGAAGAGRGAMTMQQQAALMQANAMQRGYAQGGGYPGAVYPGYPQQGAAASGPAALAGGLGGSPDWTGAPAMRVPGGGAPDGGLSAAYAAWANAFGGGNAYGGGLPQAYGGGGAKGSTSGVGEKGDGKGRGFGFGKGKGKGKGWKGGGFGGGSPAFDPASSAGTWFPPGGALGDPRRQIELAQRRAKQRDRSAISQAQRSAQQRFERDLLERVQGHWVDASDPGTTYVVEGGLCSVTSAENSRVFRNRLGVYGGELCWDARRFWHYLSLSSLPPLGEPVERVEWNPGEGSPQTRQIVWLRAAPQQEEEDGKIGEDGEAEDEEGNAVPEEPEEPEEPEAAASTAEAVAEAAVA